MLPIVIKHEAWKLSRGYGAKDIMLTLTHFFCAAEAIETLDKLTSVFFPQAHRIVDVGIAELIYRIPIVSKGGVVGSEECIDPIDVALLFNFGHMGADLPE